MLNGQPDKMARTSIIASAALPILLLILPLAGCGWNGSGGALREYSKAIKAKPNDASAYNGRGDAYYLKGDLDGAIRDYTEAIKSAPDIAKYYSNRGHAYRAKGDYGSAIRDYTEAIRINPRAGIYYRNRAMVHMYNKADYDSAIADYTEAIKVSPRDGSNYIGRGNAYDAKGDRARAGEDYAKAREL
jgi:tetratricopeptide (TPR) repeat protein